MTHPIPANDNIDPRLVNALANPLVVQSAIHAQVKEPTTPEDRRKARLVVMAKRKADDEMIAAYRLVFEAKNAKSEEWDGKPHGGVSLPAINTLPC